MKTVSFFGHSQIFNNTKIQNRLFETLKNLPAQEFSRFLVGCHGDFDKIALRSCLNYKTLVDNAVTVCVVLTSLSFLNKNNSGYSNIDIYSDNNCETLYYEIEEEHFKKRITTTNKKMVEDSDLIICYVNMKAYKSGAKTAISYAKKLNKQIINLFEADKII